MVGHAQLQGPFNSKLAQLKAEKELGGALYPRGVDKAGYVQYGRSFVRIELEVRYVLRYCASESSTASDVDDDRFVHFL